MVDYRLAPQNTYPAALDDAVVVYKELLAQGKAAADGTAVTITIYPGMSHDFALLMPDLQDSVKAFAEIRDFVKRHMSK